MISESYKIPRIIHWCWFGDQPLPPLHVMCVTSWKRMLPHWEIQLWNEKTFDIESSGFVASAYKAKKYAFVSDYVRAWSLSKYGGIYLDADVEVRQNLDVFLQHEAFTGFELPGYPFTAVWGCVSGHGLAASVLRHYDDREFSPDEPANTGWISDKIVERYGINREADIFQVGASQVDTIAIYPSTFFCLDLPQSFAVHHFAGSWLESSYYKDLVKNELRSRYITQLILCKDNPSALILLARNMVFLSAIARHMTFFNITKLYFYRLFRSLHWRHV